MNTDLLLQRVHLYFPTIPTWMACSRLKSFSSRTRCLMFPLASLSMWKCHYPPLSCQSSKPQRELRSHLPLNPYTPSDTSSSGLYSPCSLQALCTTSLDLGGDSVMGLPASGVSTSHPSLSANVFHTWLPNQKL